MRKATTITIAVGLLGFFSWSANGSPRARSHPRLTAPPANSLHFKSKPVSVRIADLPVGIRSATVTDMVAADLNGDGRSDLAVVWTATGQTASTSLRMLTIVLNDGGAFHVAQNIDLYQPDPQSPDDWTLRIFRRGTGCIAVGDFDGDGDLDLALTPFFGDEIWFMENLGGGQFAPHVKFMYGFNSSSIALSPPRALAADFDGNGRDELVYILDPSQHLEGLLLHFWKTDGAIADMYRADWVGPGDAPYMLWTRAMTVADFDGDGRPDLCFTATQDFNSESNPIVAFWYQFQATSGTSGSFQASYVYPTIVCSDVVATRPDPSRLSGVILTDNNGATVQYWAHAPGSGIGFVLASEVTGYADVSPSYGMAAAMADLDGDGQIDLVTKQKLGLPSQANQIELTLSGNGGAAWYHVNPTPLNSAGFPNEQSNPNLRPRNLVVADLLGNSLPEIIGGFAALGAEPLMGTGPTHLDVAIWENDCVGDVNRDGRTNGSDLVLLSASQGLCYGDVGYNPDADLDKNGCVDITDRRLLIADMGCQCSAACAGELLADVDCSGAINNQDIDAFIVALFDGEAVWTARYGKPGCDFLCVADINGDERVDFGDIDAFIGLLFTD